MGLIYINQETCAVVRSGTPTVRVGLGSGLISFSSFAVDKAGLKVDKKIEFVYDDVEKQLYVTEADTIKGYELRSNKDSRALSLNNAAAARKIADLYQAKNNSFVLLIGEANKTLIQGGGMLPSY